MTPRPVPARIASTCISSVEARSATGIPVRFDLPLDPAGGLMRLPLRLLFGIGYPRSGIRAAAAVQRDGEGTEFCDVIVAAFGPGCVKTRTKQQCAELFSLLPPP